MPFNGSGVFQRLYSWVSDRDAGTEILAQKVDDEMNGMAQGLTDVNTHVRETGNPHGTTAADVGAAETASPTFTGTATVPRLRLTSSIDASLTSTNHAFQIGTTATANLVIDENEVQARNNSGAATLALNTGGGTVAVGRAGELLEVRGNFTVSGTAQFAGDADFVNGITAETLRLEAPGDVSLTSTTHAAQFGPTTGANMALDANEIQARDNGAAATLALNTGGGAVAIGRSGQTTEVRGDLEVSGSVLVDGLNIVTTDFAAVGAFAFAQRNDLFSSNYGDQLGGNKLRLGGTSDGTVTTDTTTLTGTWQCLGACSAGAFTLWQRVT